MRPQLLSNSSRHTQLAPSDRVVVAIARSIYNTRPILYSSLSVHQRICTSLSARLLLDDWLAGSWAYRALYSQYALGAAATAVAGLLWVHGERDPCPWTRSLPARPAVCPEKSIRDVDASLKKELRAYAPRLANRCDFFSSPLAPAHLSSRAAITHNFIKIIHRFIVISQVVCDRLLTRAVCGR